MKVLVLGRQGQLAHALAEAGMSAGVVMTLAGRGECNIRDSRSIEKALAGAGPDVVVNAAAYTSVDRAESEADEAFAVNAIGAANAARACEAAGISLIHLSTDYVFDGGKPQPYLEDDTTGPLNVYGRSKRDGEREVARACTRHVILRTSWVYGPWGHNFATTMLRLATSGNVDVVDDQRGCPTYAPHLADAIIKIAGAITRDADLFGTYHAAGQGETTWYGFAGEIFRLAEKHGVDAPHLRAIATADYPTPARRPANSRLDCSKLQRAFGIRLPDWRTGAQECVTRLFAIREGEERIG